MGNSRAIVVFALVGAFALTGCTGSPVTSPTTSGLTESPRALESVSSWLSYHSDQSRTGAIESNSPGKPATVAWATALGAAVYGQPLVANNRIIAATEGNRVVALDPDTGAIEWSVSLGTPLTHVVDIAGCGNIDPLGITSTPAIDLAMGTVFVVGEVYENGSVHHQLTGISISTGKVLLSEAVDPPLPAGETPKTLLQRAGLAIANGRVYIGYGGNAGDCGSYHGWVVSVKE